MVLRLLIGCDKWSDGPGGGGVYQRRECDSEGKNHHHILSHNGWL